MRTFFCAAVAALTSVVSANIHFSRTAKAIAPDSSFYVEFADGCASTDDYGSNDCTFDWGQAVEGSVTGKLGHDLQEGSSFHVNLKVDTVIPWKFSCAACGVNCTTTVPIINYPLEIPMPPCPVPAGDLQEALSKALPAKSPTDGVKVTAKGSVGVKDEKGADVLELNVDVTMK
mmetsp:Transcript_23039/g.38980  ORF Transcript_23039/g.38980 Transcript_23039/m.38980 type:complete len:174 (-) Transcript_23039:1171-1692(-)